MNHIRSAVGQGCLYSTALWVVAVIVHALYVCTHYIVLIYPQNPAGHYGNYTCDLPLVTLDLVVEAITELDPQPDFIIYTGQICCII